MTASTAISLTIILGLLGGCNREDTTQQYRLEFGTDNNTTFLVYGDERIPIGHISKSAAVIPVENSAGSNADYQARLAASGLRVIDNQQFYDIGYNCYSYVIDMTWPELGLTDNHWLNSESAFPIFDTMATKVAEHQSIAYMTQENVALGDIIILEYFDPWVKENFPEDPAIFQYHAVKVIGFTDTGELIVRSKLDDKDLTEGTLLQTIAFYQDTTSNKNLDYDLATLYRAR